MDNIIKEIDRVAKWKFRFTACRSIESLITSLLEIGIPKLPLVNKLIA